jgi:hypothetical protein
MEMIGCTGTLYSSVSLGSDVAEDASRAKRMMQAAPSSAARPEIAHPTCRSTNGQSPKEDDDWWRSD